MALRFRSLIASMVSLLFTTIAIAEESPFMTEVRTAWESQQSRHSSFLVEWSELTLEPAGYHGTKQKGNLIPQVEKKIVTYFRLIGSGNRLRLDRKGEGFDYDSKQYLNRSFVRSFDGAERREIFLKDNPDYRPGGFINKSKLYDDGSSLRGQPPVLYFRPTRKELGGIDLSLFNDTGRDASIDGVRCRILEGRSSNGSRPEWIWISRTQGFNVLRRQYQDLNNPSEELTMTYKTDPQLGWTCREWVYSVRHGKGRVVSSAQVTDFKIDLALSDTEFTYQFPPGTLITNEVNHERAIARADGSLRPVTRGEIAADISPDVLMATEPPREAITMRFTAFSYLKIAFIVAAFGGTIVWFKRRFR